MGQRENKLDKKDQQLKHQFQLGVGMLFLNTNSSSDLFSSINSINKDIRSMLQDAEGEAADLADQDTAQFTDFTAKPENNKVRRAAAAMSIVAGVAFLIELYQQEKAYHQAVQQALKEQQHKLDLVVSNEFFHKYNQQYLNNLSKLKGYWEWNAQLDKRTCARCSGLSGKQWNNQDDIPSIPLHPRCRCILDFHPE